MNAKRFLSAALALAMLGAGVGTPTGELAGLKTSITASANTYGDFEYEGYGEGGCEITKYLGSDTYVKIPETINGLTVRAIDDYAFTTFWGDNDNTACNSIVSVDIPATVEKIGYMAFYRCNSLKIVNLPNSDVNISAYAFDDTPFMREIAGDSDVIIVNNILLKVKNFNGDYTVPDGVVNIAGQAFDYSCDITSVTIPSSVKRLSDYALYNNNWSNKSLVNLKSVTINGGVTDIGYTCFADCANLESVKLPNGVKTIGAYAFSGCEKLSDIDIPASVETIGNNAFQKSAITDVTISAGAYIEDAFKDCHSLKTVTVNGDDAELRTGAFVGCENLSTVIFNGDSPSIQNGSYGDYYSNPFSTSVKIVAHSGSAAIRYAKTNGNPYEAADHMQFCLWIDGVPTGDIWYYSEGTDITVPEKLDNVTITSFTIYDDNVTSVHIPKDVERFWIRTQDTSKTLPDSLTVYCYEGSKAIESAKEQNIKYEVIKPAHTHSYTSKVTKQPTCTEDGVMTYSCECGDSYTETIPAKGHSFVSKTVAPTYEERGYTEHTCSVCGYSYKDNYKAKLEREDISKATVTVTNKTYTGKALKPAVTVKLDGKTLKKGTDYTVSYKNNKNCGRATVTVTGMGSYTGTKSGSFIIKPKKVTAKKLTSPKTKSVKLTWTKAAGGVTGYEVQIATNSKFTKGKKSYTVAKASAASKTVTKLKKGTKYFARVRAYKTVGKTKYYGAWSKVLNVKTK